MPSFEGAHGVRIDNLVQVEHQYHAGVNNGFNILQKHIVTSALHNSKESFDQPKCHPRTREKVQQEIVDWVRNDNNMDKKIKWIYGPAGAGKSAISRSVAEREDMKGILCRFFAFSRNSSTRNTVDPLVPTLAYQLATYIRETKKQISDTVEDDPQILSKSLEFQIQKLIVDPFENYLQKSNNDKARCMIIDGLDECQDSKVQCNIIHSIVNNMSQSRLALHFIIFSRPELEIRTTFKRMDVSNYCTVLELDEWFKPDQDIELYLREKFDEIKKTHDVSIFSQWPKEWQIMKLVEKASGQFIYPSTVIKYIDDHRSDPVQQLERILDIDDSQTGNPYAEIDALYTFILKSAQVTYEEVSPILFTMFSDAFLEEKGLEFVLRFLRISIPRIRTLLKLTYFHASFTDFLSNKSRAGEFYIDTYYIHGYMAKQCMSHIPVNSPIEVTDTLKLHCVDHVFDYLSLTMASVAQLIDVIINEFGPNCFINALRHHTHREWWQQLIFIGNAVLCVKIGGINVPNLYEYGSFEFGVEIQANRCEGDYLGRLTYTDESLKCYNMIFLMAMNNWLFQLYDDGSCCLELGVYSSMENDLIYYQKQSMHHSRLIEYLMKWILEINHLNLPVELYFHIFKHLLTESAIPFKDLGQYIKANHITFMNAMEKFRLQKPRTEKLEMYINEFIMKCDSDECLQRYDDYIHPYCKPSGGASDDDASSSTSESYMYDEPEGDESNLQGTSELREALYAVV
ncbi:hypothetical protein BDQ17DRAFT_1376661 [Cyathus striatus]|nr:hypothetical protein BDQ17DRAFT_1376661 [Cyathus striatus]